MRTHTGIFNFIEADEAVQNVLNITESFLLLGGTHTLRNRLFIREEIPQSS